MATEPPVVLHIWNPIQVSTATCNVTVAHGDTGVH